MSRVIRHSTSEDGVQVVGGSFTELNMKNVEAAREKLQGLAAGSIAFRLLDAFLTHAPTAGGILAAARRIHATG